MPARPFRPLLRGLLAATLGLALTAGSCMQDTPPGYRLDPEFSVNVGTLDAGWPDDPESLVPAKQEALERHGRPDYFHLIWSDTDSIIDQDQHFRIVRRAAEEQKRKGEVRSDQPGFGWVYLDKNREIVFLDDFRYEERPLSPKLRIVCRYGDPQRVRPLRVPGGDTVQEWTYYNRGLIFHFDGEQLVLEDRESIPEQPNYLIR